MALSSRELSSPLLKAKEWNHESETSSETEYESVFPLVKDKNISLLRRVGFGSVCLVAMLLGLGGGYFLRGLKLEHADLGQDMNNDAAVPRIFQEEPIFSQPPSGASNAAWAALIPEGRGFVQVKDESGKEGRYCVSTFHQLHCLDMLRHGYFSATNPGHLKPSPVAPDAGPESPVPGDFHHSPPARSTSHHGSSHMEHCFDYLRQALICAADPALEERDDTIGGVRGWGTTHQCRNFEALKKWARDHRYSDAGGIMN